MGSFTRSGKIVDIIKGNIYPGIVRVEAGKIVSITPQDKVESDDYLLPGFIDAHVHIESSLLVPSEFARLATVHGTVATISDPHEIANVLGMEGIRYMIRNGKQTPFHFYFGAPSCVPATNFETSGASIDSEAIRQLFVEDDLHYLSEVMNFPGVLSQDPLMMEKIEVAKRHHCPIDGHAPGLKGEQAARYIQAGITSDHECFTLEEALDKIHYGMKILIREGSAAKNYEALHSLIKTHPEQVMFCSDDKHPHELVEGHIDKLVRRSIVEKGYDTMAVLRCASYQPIQRYQLNVGLLQPGDSADFIVVDNLRAFKVKETYIKGLLVAKNGQPLIERVAAPIINHFNCAPKQATDFKIRAQKGRLQVIKAIDGQLITDKIIVDSSIEDGYAVSDPARDLLKIVVVNRYQNKPIAIGFIQGFGLKKGAIGSSVAHDSHNIICVGVSDEDICEAVNAIIDRQGGLVVVDQGKKHILELPVAGLMSPHDGYQVAREYMTLDHLAKQLGSSLEAPFMTLSFMALLVIPSLKLSDQGLFDAVNFNFTPLIL